MTQRHLCIVFEPNDTLSHVKSLKVFGDSESITSIGFKIGAMEAAKGCQIDHINKKYEIRMFFYWFIQAQKWSFEVVILNIQVNTHVGQADLGSQRPQEAPGGR